MEKTGWRTRLRPSCWPPPTGCRGPCLLRQIRRAATQCLHQGHRMSLPFRSQISQSLHRPLRGKRRSPSAAARPTCRIPAPRRTRNRFALRQNRAVPAIPWPGHGVPTPERTAWPIEGGRQGAAVRGRMRPAGTVQPQAASAPGQILDRRRQPLARRSQHPGNAPATKAPRRQGRAPPSALRATSLAGGDGPRVELGMGAHGSCGRAPPATPEPFRQLPVSNVGVRLAPN